MHDVTPLVIDQQQRTPLVHLPEENGSRRDRLRARVGSWSLRRSAVAVFLVFSGLYLATASYGTGQSIDTVSTALPAWKLATEGTLTLDEFEGLTPWLIESRGRTISNRLPGAMFSAVPAYFAADTLGLLPDDRVSFAPAAVTAALTSALLVTVLLLVFCLVLDRRQALLATLVAGLGTGVWSVSADALWTHGLAQLGLALAVLFSASTRYGRSGLGFGLAVFARPHTGFPAALIGMYLGFKRRSVRAVAGVAAGTAVGVAALLAYNFRAYGGLSVVGSYAAPAANLTNAPSTGFFMSWALTLVSPLHGLLFYAPFVGLLLLGVPRAWRVAPDWIRAAGLSGLLYMALQLKMNRYSGGDAFFGYRLPLEALTLAAPLLALSYREWVTESDRRRFVFRILVKATIVLHALGAILFGYLMAVVGA